MSEKLVRFIMANMPKEANLTIEEISLKASTPYERQKSLQKRYTINDLHSKLTPLHFASWYGQPSVVKSLLEKGVSARVFSQDSHFTPMHYICHQDIDHTDLSIVDILHRHDPFLIAEEDFRSQTPLFHAARSGNAPLVRKLLKLGSDANWRDSADKTAADVAKDDGIANIIKSHQNSLLYMAAVAIKNSIPILDQVPYYLEEPVALAGEHSVREITIHFQRKRQEERLSTTDSNTSLEISDKLKELRL